MNTAYSIEWGGMGPFRSVETIAQAASFVSPEVLSVSGHRRVY
jgi:hypothetical protein